MTEFREAFSDYSEALTHNLAVNIKHTTSMRTDNFPPHFFDAPQFITPDGRDLELECRFKNMRSHYVHDSAQSY